MAERVEQLAKARRLDSETKAAQVRAALNAIALTGQPFTIAALVRAAGVSRRFVYDHPELRAEAERHATEIASCRAGRLVASARVTAASLRADLENTKASNHRLEQELGALRQRLGEAIGREVLTDIASAHHPGLIPADAAEELKQSLFTAREELALRTEELEAARQINRELMARVNRERG